MKHQLKCCLCNSPGYAIKKVWYREHLLLAVRPNVRSGPRPWVCRRCLKKNSKLTDEDFLKLINKAILQTKEKHES